jgi:hypothetical protein
MGLSREFPDHAQQRVHNTNARSAFICTVRLPELPAPLPTHATQLLVWIRSGLPDLPCSGRTVRGSWCFAGKREGSGLRARSPMVTMEGAHRCSTRTRLPFLLFMLAGNETGHTAAESAVRRMSPEFALWKDVTTMASVDGSIRQSHNGQ